MILRHLTSSVTLSSTGTILNLIDFYPFGDERVDIKNGSFDPLYQFTDQELDGESDLYYYDARYYEQDIGRFIQSDPLSLYLYNPQKVKQNTQRSLEDILSNPQYLNYYAYAMNNPLKMIDKNGEFAGPFGRYMASGQRTISNFLHQAANYTSNRGGVINKVSGFVANSLGDFVDNVANIYDPDQRIDTRVIALGLTVLDTSTGGEGKVAGKVVTNLGRVTKEMKVLEVSKRPIKALKDIKGFTKHGLEEMERKGLTVGHIKDAVENIVKFTKRVDELGRTSYRYVSEGVVVNFNKFKKIITGWPK